MKIALIWPATAFLIDSLVHPPLGLWHLWSVLERHGHEVWFFDLNVDVLPDGYAFDCYLVSGTTPQASALRELALMLPGRKVVGGPHATLFPEQMMAWGYDTVVVGEGERLIPAIVANRQNRGIIRTERIDDLDKLPFPNRTLAHRYKFKVGDRDAATAFTSRGCPYQCGFCSHVIWGRRLVQRSAGNVYEEACQVYDLGFRAIMYFDDTFIINSTRLFEICKLLTPLSMHWRCFIRADLIGPAMLRAMRQAGCIEVGIGIESGSQKILDVIKKGTTVEQNSQVARWCKEAGITVKVFIILGLPGENNQTIEETRRWILENQPDKLDLVFYTPYPGAPITDRPRDYDIQWEYTDYSQCVYKSHPDDFRPLTWTSGITRAELENARRTILEECGIGP